MSIYNCAFHSYLLILHTASPGLSFSVRQSFTKTFFFCQKSPLKWPSLNCLSRLPLANVSWRQWGTEKYWNNMRRKGASKVTIHDFLNWLTSLLIRICRAFFLKLSKLRRKFAYVKFPRVEKMDKCLTPGRPLMTNAPPWSLTKWQLVDKCPGGVVMLGIDWDINA